MFRILLIIILILFSISFGSIRKTDDVPIQQLDNMTSQQIANADAVNFWLPDDHIQVSEKNELPPTDISLIEANITKTEIISNVSQNNISEASQVNIKENTDPSAPPHTEELITEIISPDINLENVAISYTINAISAKFTLVNLSTAQQKGYISFALLFPENMSDNPIENLSHESASYNFKYRVDKQYFIQIPKEIQEKISATSLKDVRLMIEFKNNRQHTIHKVFLPFNN